MLLLNPRGAQEQPLEIKPPVSLRSLQSGTVNVEGRLIQDWCCFQVLSGKKSKLQCALLLHNQYSGRFGGVGCQISVTSICW